MKQIADFLRNFRVKKGLTEEDIVNKTTLTKTVIHLIERGDFESIGAEFYLKSFLKQYCNVIGLTETETVEIVEKVIKSLAKEDKKINPNKGRNKGKSLLIVFIICVLILLFFLFFKKEGNTKTPKTKPGNFVEKTSKIITGKDKISEKNNKESFEIDKYKNSGKHLNVDDLNDKEKVINNEIKDSENRDIVENKSEGDNLYKAANSKKEDGSQKNAIKNRIKVSFEAMCMCWVKITFNGEVLKDFILKENENFSIEVPEGSMLTVGNSKCVKVYFNGKKVNLGEEKVVRDLVVE